jgi:hypothetical protein
MMRWRRTDPPRDAALSPTRDEVIAFIDGLDARGLRELCCVARVLEGGRVH